MNHLGMAEAGTIATFARNFRELGRASLHRHRLLHAIALGSLLLAAIVGALTGNLPDFGVLRMFGEYLFIIFCLGGGGLALFHLGRLAFVERSPSPTRALIASLARFFADAERLANSLNGLAIVIVFATAFSVLKGAIAIIEPFGWDIAFRDLDRLLHFGRLPHEWLSVLLDSPALVFAMNFAYNFWFIVLLATLFSTAIAKRDGMLRHQFLLSFMLTWLVGGFILASVFSSAGPAFLARLNLGGDYDGLMATLTAANEIYPVWALKTQDLLWDGYVGTTSGSIGISAMPSMHVASAVLFALYWQRRAPAVGRLLWLFAAVIMLGSVVLAWHYAVDGYAGAVIAWLAWRGAGLFLARKGEVAAVDG